MTINIELESRDLHINLALEKAKNIDKQILQFETEFSRFKIPTYTIKAYI